MTDLILLEMVGKSALSLADRETQSSFCRYRFADDARLACLLGDWARRVQSGAIMGPPARLGMIFFFIEKAEKAGYNLND